MHVHSSDPLAINITLQQIQDTICNLFAHITDRKIVIAVSSVYKQTQKGNKLSVHCIVCNVQMTIDGLYDLVHDNVELLETLNFDCSVYKRYMKRQKFRCVNTCKENEPIECLLRPVTHTNNITKNTVLVVRITPKLLEACYIICCVKL